jgi:uncharacterized protein (TIGR00299 family) protein
VILSLNPVSGVSGDMLLGALLDVGAPLEGVREIIASTGLTGWRLDADRRHSGAILSTKAVVHVDDDAPERRAKELLDLVRRAVPAPVAEWAGRAVAAIARVEAGLHGEDVDEVHLHEIGGLDTVVDTVGVAAALHLLGVTAVYSAPVVVGTGSVRTRHGVLPVPAPATAALLRESGAVVVGAAIEGETVTPTGAALLGAVDTVFGPVPAMRIARIGYGAGSRTFPDRPNVLQAILGDPVADVVGDAVGEVSTQVVMETNVDDVTPEVLAYVLTRALEAGAADAWVTPIVMKKGRPAHTVHVLAPADRAEELAELLFAETATLGVRRTLVEKVALPRHVTTVEVDGHTVRVKYGPWGAKPEHDDLVAAARALGKPLRDIATEATRLATSEARSIHG